ncbi:glycosyltransferase family 2 protein [Lactobacillus amylovorus]|uniref:glycosyltransferase family 2 protein n=1 Tax=Lactobacillus amylovorus TaxID=1604 RepID=UPI003F8F42D4
MNNSPKVTIIVPMYNVEKYVKKCMNSLLAQTLKDIEILAIDDGSPDDSAKIVETFAKKDSRIKLIKKKNGGYGSGLEVAIANITSEYFLICDPDDWLQKDAVKILYKNAIKDNVDIVVGDKFNVYEDTLNEMYQNTFEPELNIKPHVVYSRKSDVQRFAFGLVSPHAKLYRTSLVKDVHLPHHVSYTDFELYILALANAERVEYIDLPLAYYLLDREGNTNTAVKPSIISDYLTVWSSTFQQLKKYDNVNELYLILFWQLKKILSEYSRVTNATCNDKYYYQICSSLEIIRKQKKQILSTNVKSLSIASRTLNRMLLNKFFMNIGAKIFVKKEKRNFILS